MNIEYSILYHNQKHLLDAWAVLQVIRLCLPINISSIFLNLVSSD